MLYVFTASSIFFRATQIKTYSWDNAQVILVGNKCDMDDERVVPPEKGKHLAEQLGMCWLFTHYCIVDGCVTTGTAVASRSSSHAK